jgi:hypothetical protein
MVDVASLPLILAGPILRGVTKERVAVWVALKQASNLTLKVLDGSGTAVAGSAPTVSTTRVGTNLHIALAEFIPSEALEQAEVYSYNLQFGALGDLTSSAIFKPSGAPQIGLSFPGSPVANLPSFVTPRADLNEVRIAQGSCRKPHGESIDAFMLLDAAIGADVGNPTRRPQQLFHTGDQIYADDVADSLLLIIKEVAAAIIGPAPNDGGPVGASILAPGARADFALQECKLTSDKANAKSHLLTFAEYCAMYLLVWSDVLWPGAQPDPVLSSFATIYPTEPEFFNTGRGRFELPKAAEFKRENTALRSFFRSLPYVRRSLANIPNYMLLDDHEVGDDLFINRLWIDQTSNATGQAVLRNGLLAYALFQGWGNEHDNAQYRPLLTAVSTWAGSGFSDATARGQIDELVGIPTGVPPTSGGEFERSDAQLRWHYRLIFENRYEVIALDTRTRRFYPAGPDPLTPAATISDESLPQQLLAAPPWADPEGGITVVLTPGPWAYLSAVEDKQRKASEADEVFELDFELIHFNDHGYDRLLSSLAARDPNRARVVVLCGDVHFALATRSQYWSAFRDPLAASPQGPANRAVFAQFLASAFKHQGLPVIFSSLALHYAGFRASRREIHRLVWRAAANQKTFRAGVAEFIDLATDELRTADWRVPVNSDGKAITELRDERDTFNAVTPEAALAWRVRRVLFAGAPKGATTNPVNDFIDLLLALIEVLFNWFVGYLRVAKGGDEVVGVNNMGFITFKWNAAEDKSATQALTWFNDARDDLYAAQAQGVSQLLEARTVTVQELPLALEEPPPLTRIEL